MKIEATGYVEDGKLTVRNRKQFEADIKALEGKDVEIVIDRKKRIRSLPLNKYYWAVPVALITTRLKELGHEVDKSIVHDFLKGRFNYSELIDANTGEVFNLPKSTTDLTNTGFMEYLEKIKQFASQTLDLYIPEPNEQTSAF